MRSAKSPAMLLIIIFALTIMSMQTTKVSANENANYPNYLLLEDFEGTGRNPLAANWNSNTNRNIIISPGVFYSGANCLLLDARELKSELSITTKRMAVKPGYRYEVSVYHRTLEENSTVSFKATIEWFDEKGAHIRYDNDWQGSSQSTEFSHHGGIFTAPAGAAEALIILGLREGMAAYFDDVAFSQHLPVLEAASVDISSPCVKTGEKFTVGVVFSNDTSLDASNITAQLRLSDTNGELFVSDKKTFDIKKLSQGEVSFECYFDKEGVYAGDIELICENFIISPIPVTLVVSDADILPAPHKSAKKTELKTVDGGISLQNADTAVVFGKTGDVYSYYKIFAYDSDEAKWVSLGISPAISEICYLSNDKARLTLPFGFKTEKLEFKNGAATLYSVATDADGANYNLECVFSLGDKATYAKFSYSLTTSADREIIRFAGPMLLSGREGGKKDLAIFPGVSYLSGDQESGGEIEHNLKNFVPHPYKVTIPAMTVTFDGFLSGMVWDPLQKWDGDIDMPMAAFSSPDVFFGNKDYHAMGLFLPGGTEYCSENSLDPAKNYLLKKGNTLTLSGYLFAEKMSSDNRAYCYWNDVMPLPELPALPYSIQTSLEKSLFAYTDSIYDPKTRGWPATANVGWETYPHPSIINAMLTSTRMMEKDRLPASFSQIFEDALAASGGYSGEAKFKTGQMDEYMDEIIAAGREASYDAHLDGGVYFYPSNAQQRLMGASGASALGIVARKAQSVLSAVYLNRNEKMLETAEKMLLFMDENFVVPSGGETWEVPLAEPNLMAAGIAIDCYLMAYDITGKQQYLKSAVKWGYRSLPFIYLWHAEGKESMGYNCISVIGYSLFDTGSGEPARISWRANPVIWVGLEYAKYIDRLGEYDSSFDWKKIAEGLYYAGIQWQHMTEKAFPDFVGTYTDTINLTNDNIVAALINPVLIVQSISYLNGISTDIQFGSVTLKGAQIPTQIISELIFAEKKAVSTGLKLLLKNKSLESSYIVLKNIPSAIAVKFDDAAVSAAESKAAVVSESSGWFYDEAAQTMYVKLPPKTLELFVQTQKHSMVPFLVAGGIAILALGGMAFALAKKRKKERK
ncbi:MAG: hypothetical protein FWH48_06965 [Oscillospiraceae bacterium]|nr:hypothetical protein [Oscillospiraceae bacterium]